jgi:Fe-S oxidoreductase
MIPNRENNYCCGGGGGQLSMGEYKERRIRAGKVKAEQIRKTGAKIVATPCHNCIDQLMELNQEYELGVKIRTISEIVADALILKNS